VAIVYSPSALEGMEVLSCSGAHSFVNHLHDGYVLRLNSESGEHFSLNGSSDILTPGAIAIIEPGVIHANYPCLPERRHLRSCYFSGEFFRNLYEGISGGESAPHAYLVQLRLEHARLMLEKGEAIAEAALSSGFSD
jgi:hypothetical protein